MVQQQPLGSIQWSVVASNLKETSYTITSLSKGVRYAFRVLASTGKTLSKPSLSTDLIQLLDRGTTATGGFGFSAQGLTRAGQTKTLCFRCRALSKKSTNHSGETRLCLRGGEPTGEHHYHAEPRACCCHLETVSLALPLEFTSGSTLKRGNILPSASQPQTGGRVGEQAGDV